MKSVHMSSDYWLGLTARLDLEAIKLVLDLLENDRSAHVMAVNLAGASLADQEFCLELEKICASKVSLLPGLWIEISEQGVLDYYAEFCRFLSLMRGYGCKIGIEHFGSRLSEIGKFHGLGLHYLKIDPGFIHNLDQNPGNLALLQGLARISHDIGALVIAEGVSSESELQVLTESGFDGATGRAVRLPLDGR